MEPPSVFCFFAVSPGTPPPTAPWAAGAARIHESGQGDAYRAHVADPLAFAADAAPFLRTGLLRSAGALHGRARQDFVYVEFVGSFVAVPDIAARLAASAPGWRRRFSHAGEGLEILEPPPADDRAFRQAPIVAAYQDLLGRNAAGSIRLRRHELDDAAFRARLFGDFAVDAVGGAIALMSLSGAGRCGPDDEVEMQSPEALELDLDPSPDSLAAARRHGALVVRAVGFTAPDEPDWPGSFTTPPARWAALVQALAGAEPKCRVALELDARIDPTIAIRRGMVFEQAALNDVQTLAAAEATSLALGPGEVQPLVLAAYCLNKRLHWPAGQTLRPTPLVYRRASGSQDDVWLARALFES
jgi:hypothetical protein